MLLAFLAALIPALDQLNDFAIPYLRHQGLNRIVTSLILTPAVGIGGFLLANLLWNLLMRGAASLWWKKRVPRWLDRVLLVVLFVEGKPTGANSN